MDSENGLSETDIKLREYLSSSGERRLSFNPKEIKIMIVDDELTSRLVIQRLLLKCGYQDITVVASAKEALRLLKEQTPPKYHVVISDIKMPEMDGIELLQVIMSDPELRHIPVIMMSAIEELQLVYQCLSKGATDYLVKPVRQQQVQNLWQNVWRKRQEQKLLSMYEQEKGQKTRMEQTVSKLQQEIDVLKTEVSEAVKAPIVIISEALSKLINEPTFPKEMKGMLVNILRSLTSSSNLYRPALETYLKSKEIDTQTRHWLSTELSLALDTPETKSPEVVASFPLIKPLDCKTTEQLRTWEFDVWSFSNEEELTTLVVEMFRDFNLLELYKLNPITFHQFVTEVRKSYRTTNPYHNFRHAFDCVHMIYLLLTKAKANELLNSLEIFAAMLCGLLHDIDHPGTNNAFQIATMSDLALLYNDRSVLENHHASFGFTLMMKMNILKGLSSEELRRFRKLFLNAVLATDLTYHMELLSKLQVHLQSLHDRTKLTHK
jgi:CheY-like chemotaxis protein